MKELMNTLKKNMQHQQALHEQYHHFETNIETPLKDLLSSSSSKVTSDTFPNVLQRFLEYLKEHHLLTFTSENILHLFTDIALTKTLYLSEIDVQLQELERYQRTLLPLHEFKTLQHENQHLKKKLHKYETFNTTHPTFLQKYHQLQHQLNQSHTQVVQLQETLKMKRMQHRRLQRTVTSLQTDLHQVSMALDQHPKKAIQPTPTCQDPTQLQQAMVELEKKVNQKENDLQSFAKQHEEMIRKIDTHYEQETKMLKAALAKAQSQSQSQHPCPSQETPESKKKLQQEEDQVTLLQQEHESLKKTSFTLKHKVKSLQTKLKTCHESKKEVLRYLLNTQFNNEDLNIHHPTPPF
ncbi:hypothetical protein HMI54_006680 [Coelomomyces lativittatus]|nr:hypothetical protein HMI55_003019 [Coelomomyces lativittatus]KAJ1504726.1 hypothetical protein HMI54_006680 [Coelomomyces lativittatus]